MFNIKKSITKEGYFDCNYLVDNVKAKLYMIWSGRQLGKSTNILHYCVEKSYYNMEKFILLFRNDNITRAKLNTYFNNKLIVGWLKEMSGGEYTVFKLEGGIVYFAYYDDKAKLKKGDVAGYYSFLSQENDEKSMQYDDVYNIIFEEFITKGTYLVDEVYLFESFMSTVLRKRQLDERTHVFLLGNTLSRVNPYIAEWGIKEVLNFNPYDFKLYDIDNKFNLFCAMYPKKEEKDGLAISKKGRSVELGEWEKDNIPILPKGMNWKECNQRYHFIYIYAGFYFDFYLLQDNSNNYFLFCSKRTNQNINEKKERIIGEYDTFSNLYTKDFTPLSQGEQTVFKFLKTDKIYFSDDLTGTTFYHCWNQMKKDLR